MSFKVEEARRVVDAAAERGIYLRLIGGLAVKLHCPSASSGALARAYGDVDFVGYSRQSKVIRQLFEDLGYRPNRRFNALHGRKRLMFFHPEGKCDVDVFLDVFEMCHKLDFDGRLHLDAYTISLAELLLSKLQVVQMNEKDLKDIFGLLADHELGPAGDREVIDEDYILALCCDDWGWYRTVTESIGRCLASAPSYLEESLRSAVIAKLQRLRQQMEQRPKSLRWRLRARLGERVRWYELPDEVTKPELTAEG